MIYKKHQGSLAYLDISNKAAHAKIALQGAHLFHYQANHKKPLLWLSKTSLFEQGKAIRGGVPICWPWFGAYQGIKEEGISYPNHGFARTCLWEHVKTQEVSDVETRVTLCLKSSADTLKIWPHQFEVYLEVSVAESLSLSLLTLNCDSDPFTLSEALHTYFLVEDIQKTTVKGLDQKSYYNKVDDTYDNHQQDLVSFSKETDRVYQDVDLPVYLNEETSSVKVSAHGSKTIVVWNPWDDLTQQMSDLSDYKTMLCVETANAFDDCRVIQANESHQLLAKYEYSDDL